MRIGKLLMVTFWASFNFHKGGAVGDYSRVFWVKPYESSESLSAESSEFSSGLNAIFKMFVYSSRLVTRIKEFKNIVR